METGAGRFAARVEDPLCPWNEGVWQFESIDGSLQVSPTQNADCNLSIQGLSALVYGTHNPENYPFRSWGDPSPQVRAVMQEMFPAKEAYLHEFF
jgi:hypothetical protein